MKQKALKKMWRAIPWEHLFTKHWRIYIVHFQNFNQIQLPIQLKENQFLTGVATSAPFANLELIAGRLSLINRIESILASEDVTRHKPDPEVYLKSAANLQIEPDFCVVFEDSFSGVTAAKNAGMKVVGVLSSHSRSELPVCDLYIDDFRKMDADKVLALIY